MGVTRRRRVDPTDEWEQLKLLCKWPEQLAYEEWPELHAAHAGWVEEYNAQYHQAHEGRPNGRRSPAEVLGTLREARPLPADLDKTCFAEYSERVLDPLGYVVWKRWKVYGEEALAGREAALWLRDKTLIVEHAGEPLSRHAVEFTAGTGKPRAIARPVLFGSAMPPCQPKLFRLEILGESGWLKALLLEDYAPRRPQPGLLQQTLFPYHEAWGWLLRSALPRSLSPERSRKLASSPVLQEGRTAISR